MRFSIIFLHFIAVSLVLSSCTVYRNQGRKNFENEAGSRAVLAATLYSLEPERCPEIDYNIVALIYSDSDYQVWQDKLEASHILIQQNANCFTIDFANEDELQKFLASFDRRTLFQDPYRPPTMVE